MATIDIAYFISSHGFGHAARSEAIIRALWNQRADVRVHLFTHVPEWFFGDCPGLQYHRLPAILDVGVVQADPFAMDLDATIKALNDSYPYPQPLIDRLSATVAQCGCRAVISDITPAGLQVASHLGIPGVLVENFTWDWIYAAFTSQHPEFAPHQNYLAGLYAAADVRIKTTPYCEADPADLVVPPISRYCRMGSAEVRRKLSIPPDAKAVLITLGGIPVNHSEMLPGKLPEDVYAVFAGAHDIPVTDHNRIRYLPRQSPIPHQDVVHAVDGVIGKLGYSTIAEVYAAGVPFGYMRRPNFRESSVLEKFVDSNMSTVAMDKQVLSSKTLARATATVCRMPRGESPKPNGADAVARFLIDRVLSISGPHPTRT